MLEVSQEQFTEEQYRRKKEKSDRLQEEFAPSALNGFWKYVQFIAPTFYRDEKIPLKKLCALLQKVTYFNAPIEKGLFTEEELKKLEKKIKNLLISFFPSGGKSRTTTLWITWCLGYDINRSFMRNCYNDSLVMDMSKAVIDIISGDKYKEVFPEVKLDPKASSKEGWQLAGTTAMTYFGSGFNGTVTGRHANMATIFDDPIKNPEEALSETYLEKIDTFIEYCLTTRQDIESECVNIIIQTRWNGKDPIGLRENDSEWISFVFPALIVDEENTVDKNKPVYKSICEAMFPTEKLLKIKDKWENKGLGWMFNALYMCKPVDDEFTKISLENLNRFTREQLNEEIKKEIKRCEEYNKLEKERCGDNFIEPDIERIAFCDYANKGTDNLSAPFCIRIRNRKYIIDALFSNENSIDLEIPLIKKIMKNKPEEMTFESNAGGVEFAENLQIKYSDVFNLLDLEIETQSTNTNKEIRILLRVGEIKKECYFLVDYQQDKYYKKFIENLCNYGKFKFGKDDAIDSLAGLLSMMSDILDVQVLDLFDEENKIINNNLDRKNEYAINELEDDDDSEESGIFYF